MRDLTNHCPRTLVVCESVETLEWLSGKETAPSLLRWGSGRTDVQSDNSSKEEIRGSDLDFLGVINRTTQQGIVGSAYFCPVGDTRTCHLLWRAILRGSHGWHGLQPTSQSHLVIQLPPGELVFKELTSSNEVRRSPTTIG